MYTWVEPMMWGLCRFLGNTFTFIGLTGLMAFAGHGLAWVYNKIMDEE